MIFFQDQGKSQMFSTMYCLRVNQFSEYFPNIFQMDYGTPLLGKKIMSEGTPSLPSFVDRGRSLLKTIMFWLRVMTISECFPNKSQMNDETPLICKNISFRGALFPRGKPICLRVHLSIFIRHFDWIKWQTIVWSLSPKLIDFDWIKWQTIVWV